MTGLRPYQQKDAAAILACLQRGVSPLYALPTGGGKTMVATHVARTVVDAAGLRVLMLVHRRELLRQGLEAMHRVGLDARPIDPDHEPADAAVHVGSIDTIGRRLARYAEWLADTNLVIADEAHHVVAGRWDRVIDACACPVLGLTATPWRTDGKGLGAVFSEAVKGPSIRELIDHGYLCEAFVYQPPGAADTRDIKRRGADYDQRALAALMDRPEYIEPAIVHYARFSAGDPCVVFCAAVQHAHHTAAAFRAAGWSAAAVDGTTPQSERDAALAGLATGAVQVLASCDLISEGVDIPAVSCAILLRPTLSTGLYIQQVGRVLRTAPGKAAATIIDCVENVRKHGMPDAVRPWSLADGVGRERLVDSVRRCPKCWRVHAWAAECVGCGYRYRSAEQPQELPGDVILRRGSITITREQILRMTSGQLISLCRNESELRLVQQIKGFKPGWVWWATREAPRLRRRYG